ncbi:MAG: hypothetical protein CMJ49_13325 [Planctomycetaceae bacterium]|nr:hypothetical protein [Planctomycetaceae bacterium]
MFLQFPNEASKRVLHPGQITAAEENVFNAELQETDLPVEPDQTIMVYYEIHQKFSKQPAQIQQVDTVDDKLVISFHTTGDPVQAEDRECYRVSTTIAEMTVSIADETECPLADISANGFGALAEKAYEIGQTVPVTLQFDGKSYDGTAVVQSIKELPKPWTRYGLSWAGAANDGGDLEKGAHQISMAVQREQLRRRSGAAA